MVKAQNELNCAAQPNFSFQKVLWIFKSRFRNAQGSMGAVPLLVAVNSEGASYVHQAWVARIQQT